MAEVKRKGSSSKKNQQPNQKKGSATKKSSPPNQKKCSPPKKNQQVELTKEVEVNENQYVELTGVEFKETPQVEQPEEVEFKETPQVEQPEEVEFKETPQVEQPEEVEAVKEVMEEETPYTKQIEGVVVKEDQQMTQMEGVVTKQQVKQMQSSVTRMFRSRETQGNTLRIVHIKYTYDRVTKQLKYAGLIWSQKIKPPVLYNEKGFRVKNQIKQEVYDPKVQYKILEDRFMRQPVVLENFSDDTTLKDFHSKVRKQLFKTGCKGKFVRQSSL
jgi:hypothetical protein